MRASGLERIFADLDTADVVLVGPGLDDFGRTEELLLALVGKTGHPSGHGDPGGATIVLDACALGCLPNIEAELGPWSGRLILTPNPTEAGILLGREAGAPESDVAEIAERYQAVVSCQGFVARPPGVDAPEDAELWHLSTGYAGLGTSGSGDILAGAIAGLSARGATEAQAACWGSHLHAAAADRLASRLGPLGFLARELADEIPALMMELDT